MPGEARWAFIVPLLATWSSEQKNKKTPQSSPNAGIFMHLLHPAGILLLTEEVSGIFICCRAPVSEATGSSVGEVSSGTIVDLWSYCDDDSGLLLSLHNLQGSEIEPAACSISETPSPLA